MQIDNSKSVISKRRKGNVDSPFVSKLEELVIHNGKVVLSEIPNKFDRVIVTGNDVTWSEIDGGIPEDDQFIIDYNFGVAIFNASNEGLKLTFEYMGTGASYLSSKRIYTVEENGEVTETLQGLVDTTSQAREEADLAATSLNHKGTYNSATQYKRRNIVNFAGNSYMALEDVLGIEPTNNSKWKKLSGFAFKNAYSNTVTYETGDYVTANANEEVYMSLVDNNTGNLLTDNTKWRLVVTVKQTMDGVRQATDDAIAATDAADSATIAANLATENANSATSNANLQAQWALDQGNYAKGVGDNLQHKGDYSNSIAYKKGNLVWYQGVTYICIQDTSAGVIPTQASYWRVVSNETTVNSQSWTATEGQTLFTLANGSYVVGDNHLKVWVGGVPQILAQGFTETSSTSFTLSEGVPAGLKVRAEWFEGAVTITRGHTTTHELGGQDELDVTKLKNYQPQIADKFTSVNEQLAEITSQKMEPLELIAHRGFASLAPQNTMTAFTQAVALGADSLECDVQISSDGIPVLIHDSTVDATTNGTGNVKDLTLAQLQALDAGTKYSAKFAGTRIPTFDEFLKFAKGKTKMIYPEIKGYRTVADIEIMVNLIKTHGMEEMSVICGFNISDLAEVRKYSSKMKFGFLRGGVLPTESEKQKLEDDGNCMLLQDYSILANNQSLIGEMKSRGIGLGTWTINDKPNFLYLMSLGVTKIITDIYMGGVK